MRTRRRRRTPRRAWPCEGATPWPRYAGAPARLSSDLPFEHTLANQQRQRSEKVGKRHRRRNAIVGVEQVRHLRVSRRQLGERQQVHIPYMAHSFGKSADDQVLLDDDPVATNCRPRRVPDRARSSKAELVTAL